MNETKKVTREEFKKLIEERAEKLDAERREKVRPLIAEMDLHFAKLEVLLSVPRKVSSTPDIR